MRWNLAAHHERDYPTGHCCLVCRIKMGTGVATKAKAVPVLWRSWLEGQELQQLP